MSLYRFAAHFVPLAAQLVQLGPLYFSNAQPGLTRLVRAVTRAQLAPPLAQIGITAYTASTLWHGV